ncbi:putative nucleic acid-binding Zn-ribbon protein [Mycobacterium sp. OAS707]|uniref:AAA family ATPase n=1 Tax=Mycobacterium sp. OAS707 TaxID=2663822 RepID=UPI00178AA4FF|nr:AAA family ATPase [Mycobacterium sp. OAS707]MBE1551505.1 putative nucleic acid-binding Zn-ribbon protein [Mycobacterium sp. OAS707]
MAVAPSLKLIAVRLMVETANGGQFGHTFTFQDGLNVIRGDNTSGKSTTLQAIIYALGVEGMLGASHHVPLPHSMTEKLAFGSEEFDVIESYVELEIANKDADVITVLRYVKHPSVNTKLVTVTAGAAITAPGSYDSHDFFVRRAGAAQREAGFHHFLADFIGWTLPNVTRMDGSEIPLYMETLFPYFYVEQKHGWSGVQARIPTYLGIRDVGKRSAEFVLSLQIFSLILQKQRIASSIAELDAQWRQLLRDLGEVADAAGVALAKIPSTVKESLEENSAEPLTIVDGDWVALDEAIPQLREQLSTLTARTVPAVREVSTQLDADVVTEEDAINDLVVEVAVVVNEREEYRRRRNQLELRIEALEADLQKHKDARTLVELGANFAAELLAENVCPTCHQDVHDGMDISSHVMAVQENIDFIGRELTTLRSAMSDIDSAASALRVRERSARSALAEARRRVRALRETLVSAESAPSTIDVANRIQLQDRVERLEESSRQIAGLREGLASTAEQAEKQRELLRSVNADELQGSDLTKILALEGYLRSQLGRYGFSSLSTDEVEISRDTYRPAHEGFDLGFDLSASDMIRVIWAYLLGMLRVADEYGGNHLNLLIFDEPKQQDTASESYEELLQEAAGQGTRGAQIIFATSENLESLLAMLGDAAFHLQDIGAGEKLLRPVANA